MSEIILLKVQSYLANLANGKGVKVPFEQLSAFARANNSSLFRQLSPDEDRGFRLRMSNLGRPSCVLQAEKLKMAKEPSAYSDRFRNLYGDLVEAASVLVMKQAGVNIMSEQGKVYLDIDGHTIDGTYDIEIAEPDAKIYDIKSASGYTFRNKYQGHNLQNLWDEGDNFGYVTQLYLYGEAKQRPVGGLIVVSKEDGQWAIVPPPADDTNLRMGAIKRATENVTILTGDRAFQKCFTDLPELYRRKETGNRILPFNCSMCKFRGACWPEAIEKPMLASKGMNPRKQWYTKIVEETTDE